MSVLSPPKGGADVQDALLSTQRGPKYNNVKCVKKGLPESEVNNISDYVEHNLGENVRKRYGEHR